jgi:hypothetical protein
MELFLLDMVHDSSTVVRMTRYGISQQISLSPGGWSGATRSTYTIVYVPVSQGPACSLLVLGPTYYVYVQYFFLLSFCELYTYNIGRGMQRADESTALH